MIEYDEIIDLIQNKEINLDNSFDIFSWINKMSNDSHSVQKVNDILIRLLDIKGVLPSPVHDILNDFLDKRGLYPYVICNEDADLKKLFHREMNRSKHNENIIYHIKQEQVIERILNDRSVILSAPTSFGKSLIIEEIVYSKKYSNIAIIVPTLALIDELRKKLYKYKETYKLIFTTKQSFEDKNLLILTPEKFVDLDNPPKIDFFIIDEFYKLNNDDLNEDIRADILNHAFYKLLQDTKKFYLIGPNIKSIPQNFEYDFECDFISTNYSTVTYNEEIISVDKKNREDELFNLLLKLKEPTLIYCKSPNEAEKIANKFSEKIKNVKTDVHKDAIEWMSNNISDEWSLIKLLKSKVAFHHGKITRTLGKYIVEEFNKRNIDYLFCTSTLIEGVNTATKNVVIFDNKKGTDPITYFDYKNICGRAGRMNQYYIGNVYAFIQKPEQDELIVDFAWYSQENASEELLIQLDRKDLKEESKNKIEPYLKQNDLNIDVIKNNNNVTVKGQIALAQEISKNISYYHNMLSWNGFPQYDQLEKTCELIWNYLLIEPNKDGIHSPRQLAFFISKYKSSNTLKEFIEIGLSNDGDDIDKKINKASGIITRWFEFRMPKYLLALEKIQQSVFENNNRSFGSYKHYASMLESGFSDPKLSVLREFGIPTSLLKKIKDEITYREDDTIEDIIEKIKRIKNADRRISKFEKRILESIN